MLEYVHENLWIARQPLNLLGFDFGTVMTVVRLRDGSLWVHSPVEPQAEIVRDLDAIGPIAAVISPNTFHHLYAQQFMEHYEDSPYFYAPGLEKKIKRKLALIKNKTALAQEGHFPWQDDIEHLHITGMPFVNEFVFYHKASKSLIASDLLFSLPQRPGFWPKVLFPLLGLESGKPGQTRMFKYCIRDKQQYNKAINQLSLWEIDRMIISHGAVINTINQDLLPQLVAV